MQEACSEGRTYESHSHPVGDNEKVERPFFTLADWQQRSPGNMCVGVKLLVVSALTDFALLYKLLTAVYPCLHCVQITLFQRLQS